MTGDVDHEVARAVALGSPDDPVRSFIKVVLEAGQGAGREAPVSHPANSGVPGRVHTEQEVLGGFTGGIGLIQPANKGRFGLDGPPRTPGHRGDVGVAGEDPKSAVAVPRHGPLRIPPNGLIRAQPGEFVQGQMIGQQVGIAQIEASVDRR